MTRILSGPNAAISYRPAFAAGIISPMLALPIGYGKVADGRV